MLKNTQYVKIEENKNKCTMTVTFSPDAIKDCYLYNSIDAAAELKQMIMEHCGNIIDGVILENNPHGKDDKSLKNLLNSVKARHDSLYESFLKHPLDPNSHKVEVDSFYLTEIICSLIKHAGLDIFSESLEEAKTALKLNKQLIKENKMNQFELKKGGIIKVSGIPFWLLGDVTIETATSGKLTRGDSKSPDYYVYDFISNKKQTRIEIEEKITKTSTGETEKLKQSLNSINTDLSFTYTFVDVVTFEHNKKMYGMKTKKLNVSLGYDWESLTCVIDELNKIWGGEHIFIKEFTILPMIYDFESTAPKTGKLVKVIVYDPDSLRPTDSVIDSSMCRRDLMIRYAIKCKKGHKWSFEDKLI